MEGRTLVFVGSGISDFNEENLSENNFAFNKDNEGN